MRLFEDPNYTRLPGSGRTLLGAVQYWRGPDHLVVVEVLALVERYRRFEYRDMVALTIRPTAMRWWLAAAYGVLALLFAGLGYAVWAVSIDRAQEVVAGVLGGAGLVALGAVVWMVAWGATCEVRLTTSVQTLVLPGLKSMRGARRWRAALLAGVPAAMVGGGNSDTAVATTGEPIAVTTKPVSERIANPES